MTNLRYIYSNHHRQYYCDLTACEKPPQRQGVCMGCDHLMEGRKNREPVKVKV